MNPRPPLRSQSVGALPREKRHTTSRVESASGVSLDVRCACQYYQSDSLLPERINPVGSRPESSLGFVQDTIPNVGSKTGHEVFVERPGMQYDQLSTKSFNVSHGRHPEADRISSRSFALGTKTPSNQIQSKSEDLEKPQISEEPSSKGLVVRSISDATENEPMPPTWQQRAISTDRLPTKRDPDTISTRSFGLRRVSRTPSKTELYIADINVSTPHRSIPKSSSRAELPQINLIAPTPIIEAKAPFSVYEEFRKYKAALEGEEIEEENKENVPLPSESCAPAKEYIKRSFPPDPDPGSFPMGRTNMSTTMDSTSTMQHTTSPMETSPTTSNIPQTIQGSAAAPNIPLLLEPKLELSTQQKKSQEAKEKSSKPQSPKLKRQHAADTDEGPAESKLKVPEMRRESTIRRKLSEQIPEMLMSLVKPPKQVEPVELVRLEDTTEVIGQPKHKVLMDSPMKTATASAPTETFSLKVDELDQYAPKVRPATPAPFRTTEKLKVSNVDLRRSSPSVEDIRSRRAASQTHDMSTAFQPQITPVKPQLFRRSDILRSSQPDLLTQQYESSLNREKSVTPSQQQNLVSVPIDIRSTYHPHGENEETYSKEDEGHQLSTELEQMETEQIIDTPIQTTQEPLKSQQMQNKQSVPRATSKDRMMQSNLLRRKNYFERTQSQDRATVSSPYGGSSGDLRSGRMVKTVSFDFGKHQSRLATHEKRSNVAMDKRDWIERTYFMRDHEYEPIGEPVGGQTQPKPSQQKESSPAPQAIPTVEVSKPMEVEQPQTIEPSPEKTTPIQPIEPEASPEEISAEELQRDIEERYFSSSTTTPRTESRTDYEIHTSQVDSSALEELPLKRESRKKGFMASAQDKSRKMQANLRSQAGKIRTKIRGLKKPPSGSPKVKERKRFKAPDFSKIKMPEMKRPELPKFKAPEMPKFKSPDMSKFKAPEFKKIEFKRPEFTKFNKPDMSKFKIPEKFSSLKLKRSKSLKESASVETTSGTSPESAATPVKKKFEFNFGTYPRVLRKKKERLGTQVIARADDIPSTETPPSLESATIPKGTRDKGPVGSRWIDKFSDVSYGDSESGKYQRYESEPESLERMERDSLERRMKESSDRSTQEEEEDLGTLQTVEQKQFAEYDEENRAIHEISKSREREFKKRQPIVHQDSDLVSEESKDVGWTDKDILRNKILQRSDAEAEAENYPSEEGLSGSATNTNQETQSTGSSSALRQKGVIEEIDDDEFFLRKRGISQDNIEIRQYISTAIREGLTTPVNTLAQLGDSQGYYPDETDLSNDQVNYGYDIPPPKPRRAKQHAYKESVDSADISQEFDVEQKENYDDNISLPQTGSDYFKNLPPSRPLRSKKQYSQDSQEVAADDIPYFDEEGRLFYKKHDVDNIEKPQITLSYQESEDFDRNEAEEPPKAPKRRKKQLQPSVEQDSYINGFGGRSVSNSFLPNENQIEEVIVYRTEHEYIIPLAQAETFGTPTPPTRRSRSRSRATDDDRTSHGADSLILDSQPIPEDEKFFVDMKENDGYAVVRKEPPPRPPPPMRRKRSPNLLDGQKFSTMPHMRKEEAPPERPKRTYSTIGPSRPPRRKSSASIGDTARQYEVLDIEDERPESPRNLHSGDVINKMKYRPLPPPPRPPREKKQKGLEDKDDKDGGGEKTVFDIQQNGDYEIEKPVEKCIEVEVSTQTDPLPDDFVCEEFEITEDMRIIEPRRPKTLEDILKEEQEAEMERAKQLAEEENLSKSVQKFREAGQRSFSERSRGSTAERSRTSLSRPTTPSVVLIEKRVPTPIPYRENETMLEASLTVQPLTDLDLEDELEQEYEPLEDKYEEKPMKSDLSSQKQEEEERLIQKYIQELSTTEKELELPEPELPESKLSEPETEEEKAFGRNVHPEPDPQESPPQPPPRKRSSIPTAEDQSAVVPIEMSKESALTPLTELSPFQTAQEASTTKLAIADLEVERLNVHALQAGRIMVSELQGASVTADELECKSGNLVVHKIELPPGFIEEIIERVRCTEIEHSKPQTTEPGETRLPPTQQDEAPARPPPPQQPIFPSEYMQYSMPPPSFYQLRSPSDEEHQPSTQHYRRRRHHRRRDSSSEEDSYRERRRSRQGTRSPEPTIGQLGGQLLRACGSSVLRTMNQIINYLHTAQKEGNERNISTAIVLLVLVALGFLIVGMSGKNIHHHHWDFFNPPGNEGRNQ